MTNPSYKFRIYPTAEQQVQIQKTFGCTRFVYNHYLAKRKEKYASDNETYNYYACANDMTQLKGELAWLREVDATALQSSIRDLDIAYQNFFRRVKQGVKGDEVGYPNFKSKHNHRKSYKSKCVGTSIKVLDGCVQLPKLGYVECRISKKVRGRILSATVSQNPSGKYFVALYFGKETRQALLDYALWRNTLVPAIGSDDAFFLSLRNSRISVRTIQTLVKKYSHIVVPEKRISPHKLRSTFGTNLYHETSDIYLVADVLGHKDVNTTRKHYAANSEDRRKAAAEVTHLRE